MALWSLWIVMPSVMLLVAISSAEKTKLLRYSAGLLSPVPVAEVLRSASPMLLLSTAVLSVVALRSPMSLSDLSMSVVPAATHPEAACSAVPSEVGDPVVPWALLHHLPAMLPLSVSHLSQSVVEHRLRRTGQLSILRRCS